MNRYSGILKEKRAFFMEIEMPAHIFKFTLYLPNGYGYLLCKIKKKYVRRFFIVGVMPY